MHLVGAGTGAVTRRPLSGCPSWRGRTAAEGARLGRLDRFRLRALDECSSILGTTEERFFTMRNPMRRDAGTPQVTIGTIGLSSFP